MSFRIRDGIPRRLHGARIHLYRNLHRDCFSVVGPDGSVVAHVRSAGLRDVKFRVQPAGRRRAIASGTRNVHAYVSGIACSDVEARDAIQTSYISLTGTASYNPFGAPTFIDAVGRPVLEAAYVLASISTGRSRLLFTRQHRK